ncbi:hypothetical protein E2C01_073409 [Portunus trituberculatus]|uniref:Uncharacterized protein n=1 Tax=Portunus trituberculatus TaxID=210409 RepID=A0A5B7IDV6_PORTR|nr:hypothetical protein [Portunus trituberculatus]
MCGKIGCVDVRGSGVGEVLRECDVVCLTETGLGDENEGIRVSLTGKGRAATLNTEDAGRRRWRCSVRQCSVRTSDSCTIREGLWLPTAFTDPFPIITTTTNRYRHRRCYCRRVTASQRTPAARQTPTTISTTTAAAAVQREFQLRVAHILALKTCRRRHHHHQEFFVDSAWYLDPARPSLTGTPGGGGQRGKSCGLAWQSVSLVVGGLCIWTGVVLWCHYSIVIICLHGLIVSSL